MKTLLFQFCLTSKHEVVCATQLRAFFVSNFLVISGRDVFNFNQHPSSWIRKKRKYNEIEATPTWKICLEGKSCLFLKLLLSLKSFDCCRQFGMLILDRVMQKRISRPNYSGTNLTMVHLEFQLLGSNSNNVSFFSSSKANSYF